MPWIYEPDPRMKHKRGWTANEPGFATESGGEVVGKCPAALTVERAEELLNDPDAIQFFPPRWDRAYPKVIYNIHKGTLYRATWAVPGASCHGFPEHPKRAEELPKELKERIRELARQRNCEEEIRACLRGKQ